MSFFSILYRSRFNYSIFVYILFPLLIIPCPIEAQDDTLITNIKDTLKVINNLSYYQEYIDAYNNLLSLVQTTKDIKPKLVADALTIYLESKKLFEKKQAPKDYQNQITAYNRLAQLVVTKEITAPNELANAQAEYFISKRLYMESFKNKKVRTSNIPNVSNKKVIYKKYIEAYKKLLSTMHGDIEGKTKTPELKKAFKEYQYWKNKYERTIQTKNIK